MVLGSTHLPNEYYSKLNLCMCSPKIIHTDSMNYVCRNYVVQVNQCQKHSFLNQLTHNMTRDCSLNSPKNTSSELVVYKYCFECQYKKKHVLNLYFLGNSMNNLLSYCGLTDARMRTSEKDLPVNVGSGY